MAQPMRSGLEGLARKLKMPPRGGTTLQISLVTTAIAIILGYPVALVMMSSTPLIRQAITIIVIAPLVVSVVVRTYGWQLILGNGPTGILNWLLLNTGITNSPVALLYSQTAVVIGSLHVFFPMMVLPLASALGKIDPRLEDAARPLGGDVTVALRPEAVVVEARDSDGAAANPNMTPATVEQIIYHGFATHLLMRLPNGEPFIAFQQNQTATDQALFRPGMQVQPAGSRKARRSSETSRRDFETHRPRELSGRVTAGR